MRCEYWRLESRLENWRLESRLERRGRKRQSWVPAWVPDDKADYPGRAEAREGVAKGPGAQLRVLP